jgi:cytochrome c oxidase assembly protein subunit 15
MAINWSHRVGALVTLVYLGGFALALSRTPGWAPAAFALALLLALQVTLGISNVLLGLPLAVAVAHNGTAAALLALLIVVNYRLAPGREAES